jgi:hypothetical protein
MIEPMTTAASQETASRRWVLPFLAAIVAVLATLLSTATASAATTPGAETRVRASAVAGDVLVEPPQREAAGQRLGEAVTGPQIVVATGVAANAAARAPGVIRVGEMKLPGVPKGVTGTPTTSGKGLQYQIPRGTPEIDPRVASIRVMDPVTTGKYQYPNGYVTYMNSGGQAVNPLTGRTLQPSDPLWHIELP